MTTTLIRAAQWKAGKLVGLRAYLDGVSPAFHGRAGTVVAEDAVPEGDTAQPDRWMVSISLLVSLSRAVVAKSRLASSRMTSMATVGYSTTM